MNGPQPPPPPVPADADLTDFKFMPLEVARLRRSRAWLICKRRPELAFFMLNLWTASWHERPAGSLEDDDDVLADAAMCSPERWPKVRADVLRGWFTASDGRLYHPVVAEKVMDSWHGKAVARWAKECDRIRKENHKRKENQQPALDFPAKPERNAAGIPADGGGIPPEKPLKEREREGKGESKKEDSSSSARAGESPSPPAPEIDQAFALWQPIAYELGIPDPGFANTDRRKLIAERLAECGLDGFRTAMANLRTAKWLRDDDNPSKPKAWVNLAKLLKPENFTGLLEGRYDERHAEKPARHHARDAASGAPSISDGVAAAFARRFPEAGG